MVSDWIAHTADIAGYHNRRRVRIDEQTLANHKKILGRKPSEERPRHICHTEIGLYSSE
jgi:hypothetical protein